MALDPKFVGRDERGMTKQGGMEVLDRMAEMSNAFVIGSQSGKSISWRREKGEKKSVLHLEWKGIDVREDKGVMDVMHGMGVPCFWTPHGHTAAGGSTMTKGMHTLSQVIRDAVKAKDPEVITTGEDSTENMIDVIDGVLYQRTLWPENKVPLFAVVYQDYIPRYGCELLVRPGDFFFIECASLFVEGAQVGRLRLRPRDYILSFQNPEHKEMLDFLGRVVGYYQQETAKKFLVYGQLLRPLAFSAPAPMPLLSHTNNVGSETI